MSKTQSFSIFAALAVGVLASDLLAQAGSTVYWKNANVEPFSGNHYSYVIRGTGVITQFHTYPAKTSNPSGSSANIGGRQFLADAPLDPVFDIIPGTNKVNRIPLLMSEQVATDYAPVIAAFFGPVEFIDSVDPLWSNNGTDSFLTFQAFNRFTFQRILYRYNSPTVIADLYGPAFDPNSLFFNPFQPGDPRLTVVTTYPSDTFSAGWNGPGNKLILQKTAGTGFITSIRNTVAATTTVINNPAISGFTFLNPVFSRTADRIYAVVQSNNGRVRGLASISPLNGSFTWVLQEGGVGAARISNFRGPAVSPDGQSLAFTLNQTVKQRVSASLATIPIAGGRITTLWTAGPSTVNNFTTSGWVP